MVRIDRFIQHVKLVEKRDDAKALILNGDVKLNGKIAKPSSKVKQDDIIVIDVNGYTLTIKANIEKLENIIYVGYILLDRQKISYILC